MLQIIRQTTKGWVSVTIMALVSLGFVFWGVGRYQTGHRQTQAVVVINGQVLDRSQLALTYQLLAYRVQHFAEHSRRFKQHLVYDAFRKLVEQELLAQTALHWGLVVETGRVSRWIRSLPFFQTHDGHFSFSLYQFWLHRFGWHEKDLVRYARRVVLAKQVTQGLLSSMFLHPIEYHQAITWLYQRRDIRYVRINSQSFYPKTKVSSQEVSDYYQHHRADFRSPARVKVNYVLLSKSNLVHRILLSRQQLVDFYHQHRADFYQPKQFKIALKSSDKGKFSTPHWLNAQQLTEQQRGRLEHLAPGQTLLWTQGVTLRLLRVREAAQLAFQEVRSSVRQRLLQQILENRWQRERDRLAELTYLSPKTLLTAQKTLHVPLHHTGWFVPQQAQNSLFREKNVQEALLGKDILLEGNNSFPVVVSNGDIMVFRVVQRSKATDQPLSVVRSTIENQLKRHKAREYAEQFSHHLLKQLQSGKTVHVVWQYSRSLKRFDHNNEDDWISTVFSLKRAGPDRFALIQKDKDHSIIMVLDRINSRYPSLTSEHKQAAVEQIRTAYQDLLIQLFLEHLERQAHVKAGRTVL